MLSGSVGPLLLEGVWTSELKLQPWPWAQALSLKTDLEELRRFVKRPTSSDGSVIPELRSFICASIELILSIFIAWLLCNCPTQQRSFFGMRCGIL